MKSFKFDRLLLFLISNAFDMDAADLFVRISRKRSVESIICMRANKSVASSEPRNYRRVIEVARRPAELYKVAEFYVVELHFPTERTVAVLVSHNKIIEILDARPRRGAFARVYVVPPQNRRKVHYAASGIQTLRRIVRAVTAEVVEIEIPRIAPERPRLRIFDRFDAIVFLDNHITLYVAIRRNVQPIEIIR